MANNYMKKSLSTLAGLYATNYLIDLHVNKLSKKYHISGKKYSWTHGDIFYRQKGTSGSPILLIHNLGHRSASYEWDDIIHYLSKNHIVYSVDLPGCGRSVKPKFIYTSYLFIQFIRDFCKDVIGKETTIIVSGDSTPFSIMFASMYPNLVSKLILINPNKLQSETNETDIFRMAYMKLLFTPIIGTSIYNFENLSYNIFRHAPLDKKISENAISHSMNAYISSHLDNGNGKFLRGSKINNFTNLNYKKQLKKLDNLTIILSNNKKDYSEIVNGYTKLNPMVEIKKLHVNGDFPHMNHPGNVYSELKTII